MKTILATLSAVAMASSIAAPPALAMPRLEPGTVVAAPTPAIEKTRVVCNWHRCWHVGYYHYYRHYGYYRPYYYAPHVGIGLGPFGVRLF